MYIANQQDYDQFINKASTSQIIAIDTEFLRDKTYFPKLCLLQLAIKDEFATVDPFAVDISALKNIFTNSEIVKIFHSPRQDIELLLNELKTMPVNVFDTQIAASFLGHNIQIGYGHLVAAELGIKLAKVDTYSDWEARPLTQSQLDYAKEDVIYLVDLYYKMSNKLKKMGRMSWVDEDIKIKCLDENLYKIDPMNRYLHLKRISSLSKWQLACAQQIAAWRETKALNRNLPRRWVLADERVIEISKRQPKNVSELFHMRGTKNNISTQDARDITNAVIKGLAYDEKDLPDLGDKQNHKSKNDKSLNSNIDSQIDLMNALISFRAKEKDIAPQLLATSSDLVKIAHGQKEGVSTLKGWRKEIVGNELLELLAGNISLKIEDGQLKIIK